MKKILFTKYQTLIKSLPDSIDKKDILNNQFLIAEEDNLKIYYAPHNEYINKKATIVIVGICPGWSQTKIAYFTAKDGLLSNKKTEQILKECKMKARFAGTMRQNIINMLDEIELNKKLNINSTAELFKDNEIIHTTSIIPYPVFKDNKNYTGHSPSILKSDTLMNLVKNHFYEEIKTLNNPLIIPLGKSVEEVLRIMIQENIITEEQCLFGFPHPSGANGHRKKDFNLNKEYLNHKLTSYYKKIS